MIQPNEIRNVWNWVRQGLLHVQKKSPEKWIPEDIYADLIYQKSMLWFFAEEKEPVGFAVLQPRQEALHVWAAYAAKTQQLNRAFEIIKKIAKEGQAKRITFDSWRKGWERKAKELGFKPRSYSMEIEL